jgi:RNA polymerase sigma-70 factor (ECF subfamily)
MFSPVRVTRFRRGAAPRREAPLDDRVAEAEEDGAIVDRAKTGDADAFHVLVNRHQAAIFNVVLRTVKDPGLAEDVTQDAFLRAWRSVGQFRGGNVRGWLMRIAVNRAYDTLRSQKRRPADSLDALEYEPVPRWTSGVAASEQPEGHALRSELSEVLERLLATLPEDQRTALLLVDLEGFSYDEAAGIMAVAPGTIKSRISRARARLREEMRATTHDSELFDRFVRRDSDVRASDG